MGRVPEAVLDPAEYRDRIREMKLRHNLFWEEVRDSFLVPRLDRRYADMPRWLRAWTKTGGKHIAIRITDMVSDPLVIGILPERYSLEVQDAPPDNLCFTVRVEKVMLMNIGYGNRGPLAAFLAGGLTVSPLFPLWDKVIFWRLVGV